MRTGGPLAGDETMEVSHLGTQVVPRVLIVDDDPLVGEHLAELVQAAGFEVDLAHSGAAALTRLRKMFAAIVISDRNMPDMDGLTLCRTLRQEQFDSYVYVMLLTRHDAESDILSGLEAGADDYLSKRASAAQLVARLRTAQRILTLEHSLRTALEEKARLATTDALTGSNNRRYFVRHLNRELRAAARARTPLSVLLLDIDHFKRVNDNHGHAAGDDVLKGFARLIGASLPRETDWCARLGGEEFAVVLPHTDLAGARVVAEKLRQALAATSLATVAGSLNVTVSVGISGLEALDAAEPASIDALLDLADRCLYQSKESGRNRVTVAPSRAP